MTVNNRLQKLRRKLEENGTDAIMVSQPENRFYLSGFDGSAGWLFITAQKAVLATDFRYIEQAGAQAPGYEILRTTGSPGEWFPGLAGDLHIKRLGFEAENVTFSAYIQLSDMLKEKKIPLELVPTKGLVESLRVVKEPGEIDFIRQAVAISDAAFNHIEKVIRAGMTELEAAWEIEKFMRENGSQPLPFDIILASGDSSALPHAKPSERVIKPGEPVVIDFGARVGGYASDLTRTICAGTPDATFKRIYSIVLEAQQAAMSVITGGITGQQADAAARAVIAKAGHREAFGHGLGHGVGLATHEAPRLGPGASESLTEGMVFTVEPGIYLPGWGGVRIEDTVTIENGKARPLSKARKAKYD